MAISEEFFTSRSLASQACARHVAAAIKQQLDASPEAALIVGGGSTPAECFGILANSDLEWHRVTILPSDERCVHAAHDASNEGMIRRLLVTGRAATAKLVPMYNEELSPDNQCRRLAERLDLISRPFAISLLGMGADGHFASLFPDTEKLDEGLNPDSNRDCMFVRTTGSSHPRISLTMPVLLDSSEVLLLFFGDAKREVYELAKQSASPFPLSKLLQQERTPVRAIWAP